MVLLLLMEKQVLYRETLWNKLNAHVLTENHASENEMTTNLPLFYVTTRQPCL